MTKKAYTLFLVFIIFGLVSIVMGIILRDDLLFLIFLGTVLMIIAIWISVSKVVLRKKRCTSPTVATVVKCSMENKPIGDATYLGNYYATVEYRVAGKNNQETFVVNGLQLQKGGIKKLEAGMSVNIMVNPKNPNESFFFPEFAASSSISERFSDAAAISVSGIGGSRWYLLLIGGIIVLAIGGLYTILPGLILIFAGLYWRKRQRKQSVNPSPNPSSDTNHNPTQNVNNETKSGE